MLLSLGEAALMTYGASDTIASNSLIKSRGRDAKLGEKRAGR